MEKERKTSKASSNNRNNGGGLWKIIGVIGAVIAGLASFFLNGNTVEVKNLVNASEEVLRQSLTGTSPYLFYCQDKNERPPSVFLNLMHQKKGSMDFANLNCSQILPSGKTIAEKFGLKRKGKNAVIFGTAPWAKPQQVPKASLVDLKALTSFVDIAFAPKAKLVTSDKEFHSFCGFAKDIATVGHSVTSTCVLLLRGTQHGQYHEELEQKIVRSFPRTKVAAVDANLRRLSFEVRNTVPVDDFSLLVHSVRNGTHFLRMSDALTWDYINTFIAESIALPLHQFDADPYGRVSLVKGKSLKFKDRSAPPGGGSGSGSGSRSGSQKKSKTEEDASDDEERSRSDPTFAEDFAKRKRQEERKEAREFARKSQQKKQQEQQERQQHKPQPEAEDEEADSVDEEVDENPDEDIIEL